MNYTINVHGKLMDFSTPQVMGILNVTPDSFYGESRVQTEREVLLRAQQIVREGGSIVDVGACSTRPGSQPVEEGEEIARLRMALAAVRRELPDAVISVDTFRPDVARMAVEEYGADIINDISEGRVGRMASQLRVPYIIMSQQPSMREMLLSFAEKVQQLRDWGLHDIILDPGFGFGKTLEQNYEVLRVLEQLQVLELPVLVGVSRKSMITRLLGCSTEEALNGTTAAGTLALTKGASILRVHDVRAAAECVKIYQQCASPAPVNN
ncbi:MAG: dihydropteroate synthase [Prevotella sp.]|nr:dihydropteroate synthase [Prevotella sp.]